MSDAHPRLIVALLTLGKHDLQVASAASCVPCLPSASFLLHLPSSLPLLSCHRIDRRRSLSLSLPSSLSPDRQTGMRRQTVIVLKTLSICSLMHSADERGRDEESESTCQQQQHRSRRDTGSREARMQMQVATREAQSEREMGRECVRERGDCIRIVSVADDCFFVERRRERGRQ